MGIVNSCAGTFRGSPLRRAILTVLLSCLLASHTACHNARHRSQRQNAEQNWNRLRADFKLRLANEQLEQGHIRAAVTSLQEAAMLDPKNPVYHRLLARCHLETSSLEEARSAIDHAKSLGDTSGVLAYTQGMLAERHSDYEEALRCYREAAECEPKNVDYLLAIAECLVSVDRTVEAKALLDEHLQHEGGNQRLTLFRAQIHLLLNDLDAAAADFEAAENLLAEIPWLAEDFGLVLVRLGRYPKGLAVLRPLVESAGEASGEESRAPLVSPAAVRALATCYNRVGAPWKAKQLMEDHLRESPGDGRGWWIKAESLMRVADWEGAQHCIERGEEQTHQISDWGILRACLDWRLGDVDGAAAILESLVAEKPDDPLARRLLAHVYNRD